MAKKSARQNQDTTSEREADHRARNDIADSITVLVHGTFSQTIGYWHRPRSRMARYLRQYVFDDVYHGADYFRWRATADDAAREKAKDKLLKWCKAHPAKTYNFIAHSHGCSVVSYASNCGLSNIGKLVFLAPPVWLHRTEYHPNLSHVEDGKVFNFHSRRDHVVTQVAKPPAAQNYDEILSDQEELEVIIARRGHFKPVMPRLWAENDLDWIVLNC